MIVILSAILSVILVILGLFVNSFFKTNFLPYLGAIVIYVVITIIFCKKKAKPKQELIRALVVGIFVILCAYIFLNFQTILTYINTNFSKFGKIVLVIVVGIILVALTTFFL